MTDIIVFDDIIDLEYQEKIKSILLGKEKYDDYYFPWYLTDDVTKAKDNNSQKRTAFSHSYVDYPSTLVSSFNSCLLYTSPSPRDNR